MAVAVTSPDRPLEAGDVFDCTATADDGTEQAVTVELTPVPRSLTRRRLLGAGVATAASAVVAACRPQRSSSPAQVSPRAERSNPGAVPQPSEPAPGLGRLSARPRETALPTAAPGVRPLGLDLDRDGLLLVPPGYSPDRPAPLVVVLHGAGGTAEQGLGLLRVPAEEAGVILLAPQSRGRTWDVVMGGFGPDVEFLERALRQTFDGYAVDLARIAVAGFSDGASYALSLGLTNGDLFGSVLAFSPGFSAPEGRRGRPRVFVSHGTADAVLAIDRTSRRIVPRLRRDGYDVRYEEFDGPHTVPSEIARAGLAWFLDDPG